MTAVARNAPGKSRSDEVLDILRRLEPTLARATSDLSDIKTEQRRTGE